MHVERVSLRDFRSYERAEALLGDGMSVVVGANGAGKTNLLEAIHFGLTGRSCRTGNERELVRHGAGLTRVALTTVAADGRHELEVALEPGRVKRARLDGAAPEPALLEHARPPVGVFLPERLDLVKGPPAHRRAHLDRVVASLWPARAANRAGYARALGQRNALLARVRAGSAPPGELDAWDTQLARCGVAVMHDRGEAVELLRPCFAEWTERLGLASSADLRYRPRSAAGSAGDLAAELSDRRRQDLERGFTTHGPHRDDLALVHGGRALRAFGSQGQQRLSLLALLFAERDVLADRGRPPLMLLDDVTSELDGERRSCLVEAIHSGGQALVTATDPEHVPGIGEASIIRVEPGSVLSGPRAVAA